MAAHSKIKAEAFIKKYYEAHRKKLSMTEFAKTLGCTQGAAWARINYFRTKKNMALPLLVGSYSKTAAKVPREARAPAPKPRKPYTKHTRPAIPAEDFVRAWQTSISMKDLLTKIDVDPGAARRRVQDLRKAGVPLKKFPTTEPLDIPKLIELANSLVPAS